MTQLASALSVRPQSGWIGAEIHGIDLTAPLLDEHIAEIRAALLKWKVVFFRDQFIGHDDHLRLARAFGSPTPAHPLFDSIPDPDYPTIYPIFADRFKARYGSSRGYDKANWHADVTAAVNPPAASILRAEVIPPYGGDTQWANTVAAYAGLSAPLRRLADGLRAVHRFAPPDGTTATEDYQRRVNRRPLLTEHPVVRVHPETGERALYVNPGFTSHIVDVSPHESRRLLGLFYDELVRPEYTVRFKWEPGSIAFWDNRATVHLAPSDLTGEHDRRLYRVTLVGDVPQGPDGRPSQALDGEPFDAA
ncbi:taurine dioxygenase [Mycolicibacterium peregrinum]|uniref:TauD/TfdA dioxygenase family protein n=1 Tax=Mycolicibacterium peregrinum TaxID=43304 RepID=UPI000A15DB1D|nr:TauD/TfdA family dioxygenase [Mycolicibacterium peregrinum]MCV7206871.1 TauD/TfdA family dioxygenase [Mycolicibacterium peregrinum]ORW55294.1 taurine dioxygenase [Mycolicibacterium peregrinum]OWL96667.1 taurine dioxygenase [Mycolicibacterium peregrinum]